MAKKKVRHTAESFEVLSDSSSFVYSEGMKALRTNIEFVAATDACKVIMITSAVSGEGKTSMSINLAVALAQNGKRVLVVDCDLRRPKIQRYLRIKTAQDCGTSTVLNGTADLDSAIGYVEELGIYVMLSGTVPPNPSELLASNNAAKMFERIRDRFEYIILDTPPVTVVSDAAVMSKYIDGAVMIVRQNYASRNQLIDAVERLRTVDTKLLGAVFNHYNSKLDHEYGYGYTDTYYSGYYYAKSKK